MDDNVQLRLDAWKLIDEYVEYLFAYQESTAGDFEIEIGYRTSKQKLQDFLYENLKDLS